MQLLINNRAEAPQSSGLLTPHPRCCLCAAIQQRGPLHPTLSLDLGFARRPHPSLRVPNSAYFVQNGGSDHPAPPVQTLLPPGREPSRLEE